MNDHIQFPIEALKVIRDRISDKYLSSWGGPEASPTGFSWNADISEAHTLTTKQAHTLRAGIIATPPNLGGKPETHVSIMSFEEELNRIKEQASEITNPVGTSSAGNSSLGKVMLSHPLQGFYVKHTVEGDRWTITWSKNVVQAAIISRRAAETIRELSGIPALELVNIENFVADGVGKIMSTEFHPPLHIPIPPTPVPAASPVKVQLRYDIVIADNAEGLMLKVNAAMVKGAQLAGGLVVNATALEYLQAIVWRELVPATKT